MASAAIRMALKSPFTISGFYFNKRRGPSNPKNLIVIGHRRECCLPGWSNEVHRAVVSNFHGTICINEGAAGLIVVKRTFDAGFPLGFLLGAFGFFCHQTNTQNRSGFGEISGRRASSFHSVTQFPPSCIERIGIYGVLFGLGVNLLDIGVPNFFFKLGTNIDWGGPVF